MGHKPPEISEDNEMTCESEVYSFGILFLCIVVGQQEFLK